MGTSTRRKIQNLLLEGYGIRRVARLLRIDPSRVSRVASEMVAEGVLINTAPKGSLAHFVRGPNGSGGVLTDVNTTSKEKTDPPDGVGQEEFIGGPIQPGFIPMRIHSLGHKFKVNEGPSKKVPWTQTTNCSGVPNHVLELPFGPEDERRIKIVYRDGKVEKSLTVWTPEVIITNMEALKNFPSFAGNRAQNVANWLMRHYGFRLGVVEAAQDFHYAVALPYEVAQAAKEIGLKTPDLWWDNSRGRGEMETSDQSMAMQLGTLPARMIAIENVLPRVVTSMETLAQGQESLAKGQQTMVAQMGTFLNLLEQLVGKKPKLPRQSDLGGMFG